MYVYIYIYVLCTRYVIIYIYMYVCMYVMYVCVHLSCPLRIQVLHTIDELPHGNNIRVNLVKGFNNHDNKKIFSLKISKLICVCQPSIKGSASITLGQINTLLQKAIANTAVLFTCPHCSSATVFAATA